MITYKESRNTLEILHICYETRATLSLLDLLLLECWELAIKHLNIERVIGDLDIQITKHLY